MAEKLAILKKAGGGTVGNKTITDNGTYAASTDGLDGYDQVKVNVSRGYFEQSGNFKLNSSGNGSVTIAAGRKIRSAIITISGGTGIKYLNYNGGLFPRSGYAQAGGDGGGFSCSVSGSGGRTLTVNTNFSWNSGATCYYTIYYSLA